MLDNGSNLDLSYKLKIDLDFVDCFSALLKLLQ